ncbi:hypothetical protein [Hyphomonas sp. UBA4494]|jgi:hypothetical protein|uniref:hypothetical protein n=1 Tax=Hyphomonas sp. UBA4494 TaxID=1946631 RepID=UPI0025BBA36D|nr:hypothetical protein [Hyphomonas sp. UBA4494]
MRRYVPRPRLAYYEADATDYLARTVYERDTSPMPTGLYDGAGNELFAVEEIDPVGFVRFE